MGKFRWCVAEVYPYNLQCMPYTIHLFVYDFFFIKPDASLRCNTTKPGNLSKIKDDKVVRKYKMNSYSVR